jgi:hypothetical protein
LDKWLSANRPDYYGKLLRGASRKDLADSSGSGLMRIRINPFSAVIGQLKSPQDRFLDQPTNRAQSRNFNFCAEPSGVL